MSGRRWTVSAVALTLFLAMTAVYLFMPWPVYKASVLAFGVLPYRIPFVDISYYLAAWECTRQGWTDLAHLTCDPVGQPYSSGPLWLDMAGWTSLTQADRPWIGWGLGLSFVLSLVALPVPRIAPARGAVWASVLAGISPVAVFAVERANFDVPLFLGAMLVAWLVARGGIVGWIGYAVVWLMAALKYYPVNILSVALRERPRRFIQVAVASVAVLGFYVLRDGDRILRTLRLIPAGPDDAMTFSARKLPLHVGRAVWSVVEGNRFGVPVTVLAVLAVVGALGWGCAVGVARYLRSAAFTSALEQLDARMRVCLLIACATLVGCFFAAQNINYRAVYLLLALPAFSQWAWGDDDAGVRAAGRRAVWLVVFVMWGDFFYTWLIVLTAAVGAPAWLAPLPPLLFWLLREFAWWWLIMTMLAVLARFAWDAPVVRSIAGRT